MRLSWLSVGAIWCLGCWYAGAAASPSYIGAEQCKLCHRAIYESWIATPHARVLAPSESPLDASCVACHETVPGGLARVECEACHGPGSDYWPAEVMIDPEKATMAGLVRPEESVCRRCHDNDVPDHAELDFVMPLPSEWRRTIHLLGEP